MNRFPGNMSFRACLCPVVPLTIECPDVGTVWGS